MVSYATVIWQPATAEIWLNKWKLLALGLILYKLKSSIRSALEKTADMSMCRCVFYIDWLQCAYLICITVVSNCSFLLFWFFFAVVCFIILFRE